MQNEHNKLEYEHLNIYFYKSCTASMLTYKRGIDFI